MDDNKVWIKFHLTTKWQDMRFRFYNLKLDARNNMLESKCWHAIWVPVLQFLNTEQEGHSFVPLKSDPAVSYA